MKSFYLIIASLFIIPIFAQNKGGNAIPKNNDTEVAKSIFNQHLTKEKKQQNERIESLKKQQKIYKIEIINEGDLNEFTQLPAITAIKVNNNNFDPILILGEGFEDTLFSHKSYDGNSWRNEGGSLFSENSITIEQFYTTHESQTIKINKIETFETTEPVYKFKFKVSTYHKGDYSPNINMTKTVKLYINGVLTATKTYNTKELTVLGGINISELLE